MDLIENYREFHLTIAEYTFLSCACGKFSRINHMLGHKVSFVNLRKLKIIIKHFFCEHNTMRLEVNCKERKNCKKKKKQKNKKKTQAH